MTKARRIRVIGGFLVVWFFTVAAQLGMLAWLGYETVRVTHPLIPRFVFLFGICCQILFQGPTRAETANAVHRRALRAPEDQYAELYTIERIYLAFVRDRGIRVIIVIILISATWVLINVLHGQASTVLWALFSLAALTMIRILLTHWRVKCRRFGTNEFEARELLAFMAELYKKEDATFDPPGRMKKFPDPLTEAAVHPLSAAEYAR